MSVDTISLDRKCRFTVVLFTVVLQRKASINHSGGDCTAGRRAECDLRQNRETLLADYRLLLEQEVATQTAPQKAKPGTD